MIINLQRTKYQEIDVKQAWKNASTFNGDPARYFAIGQSAGGHLALALTNKLVTLGRKAEIRGVAALAPITTHPAHVPSKYVDKYQSFNDFAEAPLNTAHSMKTFFGTLLPCQRRPIQKILTSVQILQAQVRKIRTFSS